jgi:biopolymer transport protein TolR
MGASLDLDGGGGSRKRRGRRKSRPMAEINVTPMVDVMLVLLIIFMVSAPLMTAGVPIELPQTKGNQLSTPKEPPLTITVGKAGEVFIGDNKTAVALDELVPKLTAIAKQRAKNDDAIYVRGDKAADYGAVMKVMGRLSAAGFKKLSLVTEVEGT